MTKDEALKLALEAFEWNYNTDLDNISACEQWAKMLKANITAIKEALAQEQEPMMLPCCGYADANAVKWNPHNQVVQCYNCGQVYTAPPQTDEFKCPLCYDDIANIKNPSQPEQEPVAWGVDWGKAGDIPCVSIIKRLPDGGIQVLAVEYAPYSYTTPPQRTWVVLTDEQIQTVHDNVPDDYTEDSWVHSFARAIEAKLKEKNT